MGGGVGSWLLMVGPGLGSNVGRLDGAADGTGVGATVGTREGSNVGTEEGSIVGKTVGRADGESLGACVGMGLGEAVPSSTPLSMHDEVVQRPSAVLSWQGSGNDCGDSKVGMVEHVASLNPITVY